MRPAFRGRTALVTGASSGIGKAIAVDLARRGATVIVLARRGDRLDEVVEDCRAAGHPRLVHRRLVCDVGDPEALDGAAAEAGPVDICVNNAGTTLRKRGDRTSPAEVEHLMAVNFHAAVRLTSLVLPGMLERKAGAIVNVGSVAGTLPNPKEAAYSATKAALGAWSHVMAVDLAGTGVRVSLVNPGPIESEIWVRERAPSDDPDHVPPAYDGRLYPPEVVARAVAWAITTGAVQTTAPRRYGAMRWLYPLAGAPVRAGLKRFDA